MSFLRNKQRITALAMASLLVGSLAACSSAPADGTVELKFLVDNAETGVASAEALAAAFTAKNPTIKVKVETRPGGTEGDNLVKTRLSTGDMTDVFLYNSGSLFQGISPERNLIPVTNEPFVDDVDSTFLTTVTAGTEIYGAPIGSVWGGGVFYNKKIFSDLGLDVPVTWDQFMANNEKIKEAGIAPVIQSYQETSTSQILVLADFHNVHEAEPNFAEEYTANKAKFATSPAAFKGFKHIEDLSTAGYFNDDFASTSYPKAVKKLVDGEGAQYPQLSPMLAEIEATYPDQADNIGFFALPGASEESHGLTVWTPPGVYIPKTTKHEKEAKMFLEFIASPEGCDAQTGSALPIGPYMVAGCELPEDVSDIAKDLMKYFDGEGKSTPALEFLSPIKGPNLENILVEVGTKIVTAEDGAKHYDEDVKKQAKQLGLDAWK